MNAAKLKSKVLDSDLPLVLHTDIATAHTDAAISPIRRLELVSHPLEGGHTGKEK